jgi:hypothetical protein
MILLNRAYDAYLAGTIVQLPTAVEAALVTQGLASTSAGPVTPGAVNAGNQTMGRVGIAAAGTSVTVTAASCTAESKIDAYIAQAVADGTATSIVRILPAVGSFTIYLNAAATAAVAVDWAIVNISGIVPRQGA